MIAENKHVYERIETHLLWSALQARLNLGTVVVKVDQA